MTVSTPVSYAINAYGRAGEGLPAGPMQLAQPEGIHDRFTPSFPELLGKTASRSMDVGYKGEGVKTAAMDNRVELHELITGVTDLELTLRTVVAFRDRFINAYNEIIKMPI